MKDIGFYIFSAIFCLAGLSPIWVEVLIHCTRRDARPTGDSGG